MMDNNRRKLLQLGAVGMPMMFTLRASAQSAVVSALQCTIDIPSDWVILVDSDGAAWVGDMDWNSNKELTQKVVDDLKEDSSFEFPAGAVDEQFRPDGDCEVDEDKDCGWGNDTVDPAGDNDDQNSCAADPNRETPWFEEVDEGDGNNTPGNSNNDGNGQGGDNDNKGNKDKNEDISCLFKVYEMSNSSPFPVGDVVDVNGNWSLEGNDGLYVSLATQYAIQNESAEGFPGVSCLVSVLNFIQTNN